MAAARLERPLGREAQIAAFEAAAERAQQGRPAGLLYVGEDGSGRSYWLDWLCQEAGERGWVALSGRCDERVNDNPYQPFFSALGLTFDKNGEIINDRSVSSVIDQIPLDDVISAVTELPFVGTVVAFGLIGKAIIDQQRKPLEGEMLLNRNFEFVRQTFVQVHKRRQKPILLCLDDLERAAPTTLALVRHVLVRNPDVPLLLAGAWRARLPVPNEMVGLLAQHSLPRLERGAAVELVQRLLRGEPPPAPPEPGGTGQVGARLRGLWRRDQPAPAAVPAARPAAALAPELVDKLIDFSNGLPALLVEGYRLLQDGAGANVLEAAAADNNLMVRVIAERHLANVPPEARPLLACAAQLGERVALDAISAPRLQSYLGLSERRILEIASALADEGRVLRYEPPDAVTFTSTHLVSYLRDSVSGPLSRRDHLRIAQAGDEAGQPPALLAGHYLAGGDHERALARALAAAEIQLRDAAYPEAAASYRLALAAFEQLAPVQPDGRPAGATVFAGRPLARLDLLRSASFAAERAGYWAQAAELLEQALPLASDDPPRAADIEAQLGWLAHNCGQMQPALTRLESAGARYAALGDRRGVARVRYYEGVVHIAHKSWARATEALQASIAEAEPGAAEGDDTAELQALAYLELGNLHRQQRAWAEAERALDAGRALAERSHDSYALAQSYHYLGMVYGRQERPEAVAMLEQARAIARDRVKQPHLQAMIENTLAETLVRARRWPEAEEAFHTSERLKEQLGDVAGLAMTYGGLARLFHRQWRFERAAEYYRRDLAMLEHDPEANVAFRQQMHNSLGEVLRLAGQLDAAEAEFAQGQALAAEIPDAGERARSTGYGHLGQARLALDRGDLARAEREWAAAEPLLRATWMEPELDRVQAWLRRSQGRLDEARAALARCLAWVDARGEDYERLQAALERARLAQALSDAAELAAALERARAAAARLESEAARALIAAEFGA
jgi:tetratricopeptide (TPR) repeat protein